MNPAHASQPSPEQSAAAPGPAQPPRHLSFMLGFAAILGGLGVFITLVSLPMAFRHSPESIMRQARAMAKAAQAGAPMPATMQESLDKAQDEMASEVVALQTKLRPLTLTYTFANLALSAGLLAGAFMVRARRERGRRLLGATAWAHLPLHAIGIAIQVITAMGMGAASAKMMSAMMGQVHSSAGGIGSVVGSGLQVFSAFFAIGLSLALAGFYVWLAVTLRRPDVRRLCS